MLPPDEGPAVIREDEVHKLARLAFLALPDEEIHRLTTDLGRILAYVRSLEEVDVTGVEPTTMVLLNPPPLRADVPHESLPHDVALREAPRTSMDGFAVPGFVDEG